MHETDKMAGTTRVLTAAAIAALWLAGAAGGWAAEVAPAADAAGKEAANMKNAWYKEHLTDGKSSLPFSFTYNGRPSAPLLAEWPVRVADERLDANRTRRALTWTDPKTGLEVRCVAVAYADYPAVEWTVWFKNTGTTNTPILEKIQGVDARFERDAEGDEFVLHGIKGDFESAEGYEPYRRPLVPGTEARYAPPNGSGKSSDGPAGWPYFNLQTPGGGTIIAVGWPGQWAASFTRDAVTGLTVRAGQQLTRLYLKPGEEIRTPLIALLFWKGADVVEAQNLWRRWYRAHTLPRVGGEPQSPTTVVTVLGDDTERRALQTLVDGGVPIDIFWRDAGGTRETVWFKIGPDPLPFKNPAMIWLNSGTWEIDTVKYPQGFRPLSDWAHARGIQFMLWFEPERVGDPNSWLGKNHPEWLLPGTSHGSLLDEGNPTARQWLTDHISGMIESQGLDWYREDMNGGGPCPAWRKNDAPNRQGMTENLYVQGHLAFWDELRRRHPRLRIDSCASGGRRNDLETMRRAVPLLRSDFQFENMKGVIEGNQGHTYGLSSWLPFQGTGASGADPYFARSCYLPSFGFRRFLWWQKPRNLDRMRQAYVECRKIAPMMLEGDYYPLTPYSRDSNRWIAWQFYRPGKGDGVVQAFRRPDCAEASQTYRLRSLDPAAMYEVTNFDVNGSTTMSGQDLMEKGLTVEIKQKPGAAVIVYQKIRDNIPSRSLSGAGSASSIEEPTGESKRMAESRAVYDTYITDLGKLPFSFVYGETAYTGFPSGTFRQTDRQHSVKGKKEINRIVLKAGDLQVTVDTAFYTGYGAYEWSVWFENIGTGKTAVIRDMRAADMLFAGERPVLKGILGDHQNQYRPYAKALEEAPVQFTSNNGRPTHIWFPYFNLEHGDGGTLIALGWGGTWEAKFATDGEGQTRLTASGNNGLRTYLKPGEKIRSPLMAFLPYSGRNEDRALNLWRRWFLECNLPKLNAKGDPVRPFSTTCLAGDTGIPNSDGSISERSFTWRPSLEKMLAEGIRFDYRWFDAGWYFAPDGKTVESDWWGTVGTWELDTVKWPGNSFRESVDFAHANRMKTLVWFEPERVTHVADLVKNCGYKAEWAVACGNVTANNIGNEECFQWTLGCILDFLKRYDVDMYREDNNCDPRVLWDALSAREGADRVGIAENKSVVAHYRLWDRIIEFCARNGKDTFVDSCASGGGRNDLESLRRGIPLMRSDADRTTTALRLSMGTAFNRWVPFHGTSTVEKDREHAVNGKRDKYIFRASYNPVLMLSAKWVQDPKTDFDLIRFGIKEWESVRDYLLKDFYLLTPWNGPTDKTHWTSYAYFDPETDSGVLFAFRMEDAKEISCSIRLNMLDTNHVYELHDADKGVLGKFKGSELAAGFVVTHPQPRSAALIYMRPLRE